MSDRIAEIARRLAERTPRRTLFGLSALALGVVGLPREVDAKSHCSKRRKKCHRRCKRRYHNDPDGRFWCKFGCPWCWF
jgi:hypothetical protein